MCSHADACCAVLVNLPHTASALSSKGIEIELPQKTAAQRDKSHKCPVSHTTILRKKRRGFSPQNLQLWGELIGPNILHWNQGGHRSQMALYKRWWLSLPYGALCNQCQSNTVNTRNNAVLLSDSRGQKWGGRRQEEKWEREGYFPMHW